MMKKMNFTYFRRLINENDPASLKRWVLLILSIHFMITSFLVSFFVFYLILFTPKGSVNKDLLDLLRAIFEYDFYIMVVGLGLVTTETLGHILIEKAKIKAGLEPTPPPEVQNDNGGI